MHRLNFAQCSGVIVDVCRPHGTWFDLNELHRIVQFIRSGGLTRSRKREIDRLAVERRRARDAQIQPVGGTTSTSAWTKTPDLLGEVINAAGDLLTNWLDIP
ncbi:MAG TPA: hypothetical protein VLD18_10040 [Verrucomicrobiae bacterium]|nr:hypothetical protein [Verrucomicrobiae bacterium]